MTTEEHKYDALELLKRVKEGLAQVSNKSDYLQLRLNYATKFELKLLTSYYNTNQSKFIRSMINSQFTKLAREDKHFEEFIKSFAHNAELRHKD